MREHEHPIAAPATPISRSAISVIRCSGAGAIELLSQLFEPDGRLLQSTGGTVHHGRLVHPAGELLDEVMVSIFRAPRSYTGEDTAEISGHGSPAGVRRILEALYDVGFHPASPGEFTRRAFLNGKLDLTRAEAINDLVNAQTREAHRLALDRLGGGVSEAVAAIRADLVNLVAQNAVQLDYPEEETADAALDRQVLARCLRRTRELAASYDRGRLVQEGIVIAIAGRTNAGKSSLFNMLLRQDRSIVSELPGTTRDYLEATVDIGGMPARLFDTAGLRPDGHESTGEPIEMEGIRRSRSVIAAADLVLYVLDATDGFQPDDRSRIAEISRNSLVLAVWNKTDLTSAGAPEGAVAVSALTGRGGDELNREVLELALQTHGDPGTGAASVIIDSARQHHLLERTAEALAHVEQSVESGMPADVIAVDLQDAVNAIGEITGEVVTDEVLDAMFSSFCLGK